MTKVFNFNFFVNRSLTITVTFSSYFNLIPMLTQQLNQAIPRSCIQISTQQLMTLSPGVSFQFLGRKIEVVILHDSAVGSGQPTEGKTKNLGNIGLDIETDLRDSEEKNSSGRISEGPGATSPGQQQGSLARENVIFVRYFTEKKNNYLETKSI
jgi:hypothetical protein